MFNHRKYLEQFLLDYLQGRFTNNSVAQVTRSSDFPKFQIIGVHHLMESENEGKHNLFLDVIDTGGNRLNHKIEWGWMGQRPDEIVQPVVLDKPPWEPFGNIAMGKDQVVWAKVLGQNSDVISGVTTLLPDEGHGNTIGHHSYYVVWLWTEGDIINPPPPPIDPPTSDWEQKYKDLAEKIKDLAQSIQ